MDTRKTTTNKLLLTFKIDYKVFDKVRSSHVEYNCLLTHLAIEDRIAKARKTIERDFKSTESALINSIEV